MSQNRVVEALRSTFGITPRQEAPSKEMTAMNTLLGELETDNLRLTESLGRVQMMIDAQGWHQAYEHGEDGGLSLASLKQASEQLRELVAGNGPVKQGSQARNARIWGEGLDFHIVTATGKTSNLPARAREIMLMPRNQRYVFDTDARHELERAALTDGMIFLAYDGGTQEFMRIPLEQITADWRNPDNPEEVWAYRRQWRKNITAGDSPDNLRTEWIYSDIFDGKRAQSLVYQGKRESVNTAKTMVDKAFNRQSGWAYGIPDALPVIAWARLYNEFLVNGFVMSRALAQIAYKSISPNNTARQRAAAEVTMPGQAGSTASMTSGNDLLPMATAGKGYDFDSGRPLAAMIAASLEVGLSAILNDEQGGESKELDRATIAMAAMRRQSWESFWQRIFRLLKVQQEVRVTWHDIREEQIQRVLQSWALMNSTGLFKPEPIQRGMAKAVGLAVPGDIPEGYLIPNNAKSLSRKDIDTDGTKPPTDEDDPDQGRMPSDGSGQGQDAPAGGLGNDHSTDTE